MSELFLDFETRSRVDIRRVGTYRYAEDPSTEAVSASWAVDDGPVRRWRPDTPRAYEQWLRMLEDPRGPVVVAHQAEFEQSILREKFKLRLPASRFRCTSAQAAAHGLPRGLDGACRLLSVEHQKDDRGKRLLQKLSKPRRSGDFWERDDAPEDYEALEEYCDGDVEAMRDLRRALPPLPDVEQRLWELTARMNERGIRADVASARVAVELAARERARLDSRFTALVGAGPRSPRARKALGMASLDKVHVRDALKRADLEPRVREALLIRQRVGKSSVAKLDALLARVSADGRLRGSLTYSAAERTQRWGGSGFQPQNMTRGSGLVPGKDYDLAFGFLREGALDLMHEDVLTALSDMLRGFLLGPMVVGDLAQVEARVTAWGAGQADLVAAFAGGQDVYCDMASSIYGHKVTKADFDEVAKVNKRFIGKESVLGCGFGLGGRKFREHLRVKADVHVTEEYADRVVWAFRRKYPRICAFWRTMEAGFRAVVERRMHRVKVGPAFMGTTNVPGGALYAWVELPSGRRLWYLEPRVAPDGTPSYIGRDPYTKQWGRVTTYGGHLVANWVQATAREVVAAAMLRLDGAGFPLVLQVHDELVAECGPDTLEDFTRAFSEAPPWAAGLPLKVETYAADRYRKE